jgi:hypothetical protein
MSSGLDVDPRPGDAATLDLVWLKPAWAGTVVARVVARTMPSMGTLRPGAVRPLAARGVDAQIETIAAEVGPAGTTHRDWRAGQVACWTRAVLFLLGTK